MGRVFISTIFGALAGAAVACTFLVDADRVQCESASDCPKAILGAPAACIDNVCQAAVADGGPDAEPDADLSFACVGKVPRPPDEEPESAVPFSVKLFDLISENPIVSAPVKACRWSDPSCATPIAGTETSSDAEGVARVMVPSGFRGYLDLRPASGDIVPMLIAIEPIPDKRNPAVGETPVRVPTVTNFSLKFIAGTAGKTVNDAYGHLFFTAENCLREPAADLIVQAEPVTPDTFPYYTDVAGTPSATQQKTSSSGHGGYMNLAPGKVLAKMNRDNGQTIGTEEVTIREKSITIIHFDPTP